MTIIMRMRVPRDQGHGVKKPVRDFRIDEKTKEGRTSTNHKNGHFSRNLLLIFDSSTIVCRRAFVCCHCLVIVRTDHNDLADTFSTL